MAWKALKKLGGGTRWVQEEPGKERSLQKKVGLSVKALNSKEKIKTRFCGFGELWEV